MSFGAFVHAELEERKSRIGNRAQKRSERAMALIADRLPDLHDGRPGEPCPWAVWALLRLWQEHGEGKVTASMIRAERAELVQRHERRWGRDPQEATA